MTEQALVVADAAGSATIETFAFGEDVSVIDGREAWGYFDGLWRNGDWYEPPVSFQGLAKAYLLSAHHQSAIGLKLNLLRRHFDLDLAELSHHENVGLLAYSPLAGGLITGKYFDGQMPRGSRGDYQKGFWRLNEYSEAAGKEYLALAARHGLDVAQMAIAFAMTRPFMTSVIIGATSTAQLANAIGARDLTLSPELLAEIDAIHRRYPRPI